MESTAVLKETGGFYQFRVGKRGRLLPHRVKLGFFIFLPFRRTSRKKVMSVVWQEWQVWGIITDTWKVCVSTFGHLRRIDPRCAAAGLMSTDSHASNEKRAIASVFHQPCAPSVQHPHNALNTRHEQPEQRRVSCHRSMQGATESAEGICGKCPHRSL